LFDPGGCTFGFSIGKRPHEKRPVLPLLIIGIGTVLILSAIYINTNLRTVSQAPQPLTSEEETFPEIPRVTLKDAFTAFQGGSAVFIDVRDADSYHKLTYSRSTIIP